VGEDVTKYYKQKHLERGMRMRAIYDKHMLETLSIGLVSMEHPDWSDEKKVSVGRSKEALEQIYMIKMASDFKSKLRDEYRGKRSDEECAQEAKRILKDIQPELIQNINEWIDGTEISDIKIHGVSIPDIMNRFGNERQKIHFIHAVKCMIDWKETGYADPNYYRHYFSHL
jgi:hypothetical protein